MKKLQNYWNKHIILLKIGNLYFLKSWFWLLYIIFPLISIAVIYFFKDYASTMMPSAILYSFFPPFYIFNSMIVDLKRNSIIEKMFVFSKKPIYSNVIVAVWLFLLTLLSFLWNFFIIFLVSLDKNSFENLNLFENIDWGSLIFAVLLSAFLITSISSIIYTFINSLIKSATITGFLVIFFIFFSGSFIPMNTISNVNALTYISYLSPFKYISSLLIVSMNNGAINLNHVNIFDFSKNFEILTVSVVNGKYQITSTVLFHSYDMILNIFIPLILTICFLSLSLNSRMCRRK